MGYDVADGKEFILKIEAYTPETFPMGRLAEYMRDLANMLGEPAAVHFVRLLPGSTGLVHKVDDEAIPKVEQRIIAVKTNTAPVESQTAARAIDRKMQEDNASGALVETTGAEIIQFPGAKRLKEPVFGPINQAGTLDGVVVRVGGKTDPVPVMLQTRETYEAHCVATREVAKELGKFIFTQEIRCAGVGRWLRNRFGDWELQRFAISGFEPLEGKSLTETLAELQTVRGGWKNAADPWAKIRELRDEDETD